MPALMSESDGSEDGSRRVTRSQAARAAAAAPPTRTAQPRRGHRRMNDDGPPGLLSDNSSGSEDMEEDGGGDGGEDEEGYVWDEDEDDEEEEEGGDDEDDGEDAQPMPGVAPALQDMLHRLRGHPMFDLLAQLGGAGLPQAAAAAAVAAAAGAAHGPDAPPPLIPMFPGPDGEAGMGMGDLAMLGALGVPMPGGGGPAAESFFRNLMSAMHPGGPPGFAAAVGAVPGGGSARRTPEQVVAAQDAWLEAQAAEQARIAADAEQLLAVPETAPVFVDVCGVAAAQQRAKSEAVCNALKDQQFVQALLQKMAERAGGTEAPLNGPLLQKTVAMLAG
jgi:hypothetical protein